ncbi:MAG: riboflavin synthase [Desulfobacterales bacterium]|nr:riboflavin synthase [Desulfobacterales bacterium]
MFTGIIEGLGNIVNIKGSKDGKRLTVKPNFSIDTAKIGDSIAVNGACLTIVTLNNYSFDADVSPETIDRTTFKSAKIGDIVNLERALTLSSRLDGHLVTGHVDGTGILAEKKSKGTAEIFTFKIPNNLSIYMIEKGSVAIDGISLTINKIEKEIFEVSIIPHTLKMTTLSLKKLGNSVNIETDIIGKYIEQFLKKNKTNKMQNSSAINMDFLRETGFL